MVWVKAEIDDDTNQYVEQLQDKLGMSKPEVVAYVLKERARNYNE